MGPARPTPAGDRGGARLAELHGHRLSQEEAIVAAFRMALEPGGTKEAGRPAYQIAIKTCPDCQRSWQHGGGRDQEVAAHVVAQARCDAEHLGSLDADEPARKTSSVTPRMREQVFARDGYSCRVPGCRRTYGLDIHHIVFQEHGGGHELSNLMLICNQHHAALHRGKLVLLGRAPHDISVTFPRGHATDGFEDLEADERTYPAAATTTPTDRAPSHAGHHALHDHPDHEHAAAATPTDRAPSHAGHHASIDPSIAHARPAPRTPTEPWP